jgi:hypothetical protein
MNDDAFLYEAEHGQMEEPVYIPCKHLNHDKDAFPRFELKTESGITFWYRKSEEYNKRVQFCRKRRQRINGYLDCYEPGYCSCYEASE